MEAFELEYYKGRWLAPLEVIDELYDALLRLPANGQTDYITLGSRDSDVEICCATKPTRLVKEPFAYTEAEAHTKLSAWREKSDSNLSDKDGADHSPEISVGEPILGKTGSRSTQDPLEPPFANSEAEAVRCLRDRGYIVAPPRASTSDLESITPPPPYSRHLSSSQPVRSIAKSTDIAVTSTNKRKRDDDGRDDSPGSRNTCRATSCPSTPTGRFVTVDVPAQTGVVDAGSHEVEDDNAEPDSAAATAAADDEDDEDDEVISAPQRKRRQTTRIPRTEPLQKPTTPPRCLKTRKGTLTSTISYEAAAELIGAAPGTVDRPSPIAAEHDAAISGHDAVRDPPPTSSPEEIGALNLLSLSTSAPNTPLPGTSADDEEDSLFLPNGPPTELQSAEPTTFCRDEDTMSEITSSVDAADSSGARGGGSAMAVATLTAEERRLYRHFYEDVKGAEGRWDHSSTVKGMAALQKKDPQLHVTFRRCLTVARRTMGEGVVHKWRDFQEEGWEKRRQCKTGATQPVGMAISTRDSVPTVDPARGYVVAEAYRQFRETVKAKTDGWKSCFRYRRATVGLDTQYEDYTKLRNKQSACGSSASQSDRSMMLRALFREMHSDWRNDLPDNFTDKQAKSRGYGQEWKSFNRAMQDGRRWKVFVDGLGLGALLLIDTSGNVDYLQQQIPIPVFAAWVQLVSRVRLDVKEVAARVEGYYDGMEDPSFLNRKLRPLKLERRAYRACSPGEQFEFSGSEGGKTPTADPNNLMRPSDGMAGEEYAIEDFIDSSGLEDADMLELPGSSIRV
jgi:hypothetical protein